MTTTSQSVPSFASLRKQAKQWLRALRSNDVAAHERFINAHPQAPANPGLREVQHALARELGFAGWPQLKAHAEVLDAERLRAAVPPLQQLFAAAQQGDVARVAAVLDRHPGLVNERGKAPDSFGKRTALHYGVEHAPVVKMLLERGADPNIRDDGDNAMPLHFAAEHQDLEVIKLLIEHGADPVGDGTMHELDVLGWCAAWHYITAKPEVADYLLAHGARYTIFTAVALGALDAIRDIVARDPAELNRPMDATNHRRRPLHLAITKNQPAALALLLELGADTDARDRSGLTPLDQAALCRDRPAADTLLANGAQLELPAAVALERTADIERLLAQDPDSLKPGGRWDTLIVRAAEFASGEVIATLLKYGASVNATSELESGATALHLAAFRGNEDAVRVLLAHGADPTRRDYEHGSTPLGWAHYAGRENTQLLLRAAPFDIFDAIVTGREERVREILDGDPAALERNFGETTGLKNDASYATPLVWAVGHNKPALVKLLLERGARVLDAPDGETPLEHAEEQGYDEIAALLRQHASQPPPAHIVRADAERAVRSGKVDALEKLLQHNAALFRAADDVPVDSFEPDYSSMDAREIIRVNHRFESWQAYEHFREQMQIALSPETRFEAAADAVAQGNIEELRWLLRTHPELVRERSPRSHRATLMHYTRQHDLEYFRRTLPSNVADIARLLVVAGAAERD